QAENVTQQHPAPPVAVEGQGADPGDLRQPGLPREASPARRMPVLRTVRAACRAASGPRVLIVPEGATQDGVPVRELLVQLGMPVQSELLDLALTHRSYAYEKGGLPTNERLEFLGDAVLGLVVTEHLYLTHPTLSKG